jgi:hypothetical protein
MHNGIQVKQATMSNVHNAIQELLKELWPFELDFLCVIAVNFVFLLPCKDFPLW